jgi:hypothetical protein
VVVVVVVLGTKPMVVLALASTELMVVLGTVKAVIVLGASYLTFETIEKHAGRCVDVD